MGLKSRQKGKAGEREARDQAKTYWFADDDDCIRAAQSNGKYSEDVLNALPNAHVEVKRYGTIGAANWMDKTIEDCPKDKFPVVMMRQDHGDWLVLIRIQDTPDFVEAYCRARDEHFQL